MFEIYPNLFIGSQRDCTYDQSIAVIHACKTPCHEQSLGYKKSLNKDHPHYLFYEYNNHLFLNIIDPPEKPLFYIKTFTKSLEFIEKHLKDKKILIHCNNGRSRAPSIGLLFLKKTKKITENCENSIEDFKKIYPIYNPQGGIQKFLREIWNDIK